jgi:hypothetical protein
MNMFSQHRLERYIQSQGGFIPDDISLFDYRNGPNKDQCPFCFNVLLPHEKGNVTQFQSFENDLLINDAQCVICELCSFKIQSRMSEQQLFSDKVRDKRISYFRGVSFFPEDFENYSSPTSSLYKHCPFCNVSVRTTNLGGKVPLTQGRVDVIREPLSICDSCFVEIQPNLLQNHYDHKPRGACLDKCYECKKDYRITSQEYSKRERTLTLGGYGCDTCLTNNRMLIDSSRHVTDSCSSSSCSNRIVVDMALLNPEMVILECSACLVGRDNSTNFYVGPGQEILVKMAKNRSGWHYELHVIKPNGSYEMEDKSEGLGCRNVFDCSFIATQAADILYSKIFNQLSLDL